MYCTQSARKFTEGVQKAFIVCSKGIGLSSAQCQKAFKMVPRCVKNVFESCIKVVLNCIKTWFSVKNHYHAPSYKGGSIRTRNIEEK